MATILGVGCLCLRIEGREADGGVQSAISNCGVPYEQGVAHMPGHSCLHVHRNAVFGQEELVGEQLREDLDGNGLVDVVLAGNLVVSGILHLDTTLALEDTAEPLADSNDLVGSERLSLAAVLWHRNQAVIGLVVKHVLPAQRRAGGEEGEGEGKRERGRGVNIQCGLGVARGSRNALSTKLVVVPAYLSVLSNSTNMPGAWNIGPTWKAPTEWHERVSQWAGAWVCITTSFSDQVHTASKASRQAKQAQQTQTQTMQQGKQKKHIEQSRKKKASNARTASTASTAARQAQQTQEATQVQQPRTVKLAP